MALTLPQLDDRRFSDLTAELRSLIPRYDKTWTNHNPADPGMTLVELFAWLAELVIYRLNRVEDRTYRAFLELLGVQPSAPRTTVTYEIRAMLTEGFVIPQGTRTAARDEDTGEEILFETISSVPLSEGRWDADRSVWVFKVPAVNIIDVECEFLGFGTGKPNQELALRPAPVFLDRENEEYDGNPKIFMDDCISGPTWEYHRDLLGAGSTDTHCTVEHLANLVRFGDDVHGAIPPEGAKIYGTYRRLGGIKGNVKARAIKILGSSIERDPVTHNLIDPRLITVFNEYPAEGGVDDETLDDLLTRGLRLMTERSRAVSQEDFEALTKQSAPGRVARAKAVFDRNLEDPAAPRAEAHVSVRLLPACGFLGLPEDPRERYRLAGVSTGGDMCAEMAAALAGAAVNMLYDDVFAFLDKRRLITTAVHVVRPVFVPLSLMLTVRAKAGVDTRRLEEDVRQKVVEFLDPYRGWIDGDGWPFGRSVYRSELYQQLEGVEGVDHVERFTMNDDDRTSTVIVEDFNLPCLRSLSVTAL